MRRRDAEKESCMKENLLKTVSDNLKKAKFNDKPFVHWTFDNVFSEKGINDLLELPLKPPVIFDHCGKRENYNSTRFFFNSRNCKVNSTLKNIVSIFNNPNIILKLKNICNIGLSKGKLRIEYTLDTGDFWLEPHRDLREKLLTILVYLSKDTGSSQWGTAMYDKDLKFFSRVPYKSNSGFMFVPGDNTWYGFPKQNIKGIIKSLIINYVSSDWKNPHELAPTT